MPRPAHSDFRDSVTDVSIRLGSTPERCESAESFFVLEASEVDSRAVSTKGDRPCRHQRDRHRDVVA